MFDFTQELYELSASDFFSDFFAKTTLRFALQMVLKQASGLNAVTVQGP